MTEDSHLEVDRVLAQKALARACADWIRSRVKIRTVKQKNFLHGKLYHVKNPDGAGSAALTGSSNFTRRGLGFGFTPNIELNLDVGDEKGQHALLAWFDNLWNDNNLITDAKAEVLAALERLYQPYAPEFVYYKTLFHIFAEQLADHSAGEELLGSSHLYDTEIWKALYKFQKDGAKSAINRLLQHNGCIIADSVGLGKTWTALAVIKFFELRNERVLVLSPNRLKKNWERYTSWAASRHNPLEKDRLGYTVLAHTDLSRDKGMAGSIDLEQFNWGAFDLVVIDESHNFRNDSGNRYKKLLDEVIRDGVRTKVLMLSATPVNTTLRDLRNQVYLIIEKQQDAFKESLGIGDIQSLFATAQREFLRWEQQRQDVGGTDKNALLEKLGAGFLKILDALTIARSRDHIRHYYPEIEEQIGGFPIRAAPINLAPPSDSAGELSYDDLHKRIGDFQLSLYQPSQYLKNQTVLDDEKKESRFDQRDRETFLMGMMRVNLLKRLESSVHSFALTVGRTRDKMEDINRHIEDWRVKQEDDTIDISPEEDEEDEEYTVGKRRPYKLSEIDVDHWQRDLLKDKEIFEELFKLAQGVTVKRDAKLAELMNVLMEKIKEPTVDKDGHLNCKALIFTTFSDTATYLYENVANWANKKFGVHVALITGSGDHKSTSKARGFEDILAGFAPHAQRIQYSDDERIDILIATDCLSEGQNLQDCDLVINYDIHWNPVRLMQRFGRIDRLGSRNKQVSMTNFWPTEKLNDYLDLQNRVAARMMLADATATGRDDPLGTEAKDSTEAELRFRDKQLLRLRSETLDIEEAEGGVSMSDLTLDDFIADLLRYIEQHRAELEAAPCGIYAIADSNRAQSVKRDAIRPGVIFCLEQTTPFGKQIPNRLGMNFLVHVRDDGIVRYTFHQARQSLILFRELAAGNTQAARELEDAFDQQTASGQNMEKYEKLLHVALKSIAKTINDMQLSALTNDRGALLTTPAEQPNSTEDFRLVTWLVIVEGI